VTYSETMPERVQAMLPYIYVALLLHSLRQCSRQTRAGIIALSLKDERDTCWQPCTTFEAIQYDAQVLYLRRKDRP